MGFFDWLTDYINDLSVARMNRNRQGLVRYKPCQVGCFVEQDGHTRNTLVSGGTPQIRSEAIGALCIAAANDNIPVVILHSSDRVLEKRLDEIFFGHPGLLKVDPAHPCFDPIGGIDRSRISKLIMNASGDQYKINSTAATYIDGLLEFLSARGRWISTKVMSNCPHEQISQLLLNASAKNTIPAAVCTQIQTQITKGSSEASAVKKYFQELYDQCSPLHPGSSKAYQVSIPRAIQNRNVLLLDVIEASNDLLIRLIVQQLKDLAVKGHHFLVILDDLTLSEENGLKKFSTTSSSHMAKVYAGRDLFSLCQSEETLFDSILGQCGKWFVFKHLSGVSAKQWEAGYGQYVKIDTSYNYGRNSNSGLNWWWGSGIGGSGTSGSSSGKSYADKDEPIFRANRIQKMGPREGLVYTEESSELAHVENFLAP